MKKSPLSAVILTRNSARTLERCLQGLGWIAEILVLDDHSTDQTREIAERNGAAVYAQSKELIEEHGGNFDVVRNFGFSLAQYPWILVLDSDEEISLALREEITETIGQNSEKSFFIPRDNLYWGRSLRLLGKDYQLRLFQKGAVRYDGFQLDARPKTAAEVGYLNNPLIHHSIEDFSSYLKKLNTRTSLRARLLLRQHSVPGFYSIFSGFFRTFGFYYFKQQTFRDGFLGLFVSLLYALDPALTNAKCLLMRRESV